MIDRTEILELAQILGLRADIVEKDYVLGWLLAAINQHPSIKGHWIFKGGTCLKKCYFETYRFSEDLDFTLKKPSQISEDFLLPVFLVLLGMLLCHQLAQEPTMIPLGISPQKKLLLQERDESPHGKALHHMG